MVTENPDVSKPWRMKHGDILLPFSSLMLSDFVEDTCDVVIVVEGERFEVHGTIISAASSIFKVMLSSGMRESISREIVLKSVKKGTWELAMRFMYTGLLKIENEESGFDVLDFAHQYEMDLLLRLAEIQVIKCISKNKAFDGLVFANKLSLKDLSNAYVKKIGEDFITFSKTAEFRSLPFLLADEILKSNDLIILSELDVVQAIIGWASDDILCKKEGAPICDSTWKIAKTRHLFRNVKIEEMGDGEIAFLGQLPELRGFPDFLGEVLSKVNLQQLKSSPPTIAKLYQPRLLAKSMLFYFQVKTKNISSSDWSVSPSHTNKNDPSKKFQLYISTNKAPAEFKAVIVPNPSSSLVFLVGKNRISTVIREFSSDTVTIPMQNRGPDENNVFGVRIFS